MKKIGIILKRSRLNSYENIQFKKAATKHGIDLDFIFIEDVAVKLTNQGIKIYFQNNELGDYLMLINRLGSGINQRQAKIVDTLSCKYNVLNDGSMAMMLKDKYGTALKLSQAGINIIPTMISPKNINLKVIDKLMDYPLVHKSNSGSIGKGIYRVHNNEEMTNLLELTDLVASDYFYILQDLISDYPGEDIRVIMYGQEPIGAMKRYSKDKDFRTNYSLYQQAEKFVPSPELIKLCQEVVRVLGADICGIDLLQTKTGYLVCEVNSAPGFMGMDEANQISIANEIIYRIKKSNY